MPFIVHLINSIRQGAPARGIVTKTVQRTPPGSERIGVGVDEGLLEAWDIGLSNTICIQWRIQDFLEEGAPTPQGDANIRFCQFFPKTA